MKEWLDISTCPKEGQILLDVGLPWAVVGSYNAVSDDYVYCDFRIGMYKGEYKDTYFENDFKKKPLAWMPLPKTVKL